MQRSLEQFLRRTAAAAVAPLSQAHRTGFAHAAFALLWLFVFAIPSENGFLIPGMGTAARLIGIMAFAFTILAVLEAGRVRPPGSGLMVLGLFALWVTMSYAWSFDPDTTGIRVLTCVQLYAFAWLVWELCGSEQEQVLLMQAFVFGTMVSCAETIALFLANQGSAVQRYAGAGLNPNDLGLCVAMSIPLSYLLSLRSGAFMRWFYQLQIMLVVATILLTASRTALLAGIVAVCVVPVVLWKMAGPRRLANLAIVIAMVVIPVLFAPQSVLKRLSTIPSELSSGTLTGRTLIWKAGLEVFWLRPLLGIGAGAYPEVVAPVIGLAGDGSASGGAVVAHNTFLSVLVEEGVIGLAIFCLALALLLAAIWAMPPLSRICWAMVFATWAVGVMAGTWEFYKATWFLFSMVLVCGARRITVRTPAQLRHVSSTGAWLRPAPVIRASTRSNQPGFRNDFRA